MLIPVILSGGVGSRLWPLSRQLYPKQLLNLLGERTMLQQTVRRVADFAPPIVVCQEIHRFLVAEQLEQTGLENPCIILEPKGRNTAPAIALAARHSLDVDEDAVLLVMPADHLITDTEEFVEKTALAHTVAEQDFLVTFGIKPQYAETGYGYIKSGKLISKGSYRVECFVEKPDRETAENYLASGNYYWNSGMFVFRASVFLDELEHHSPRIHDQTRVAASQFRADRNFLRPGRTEFKACPAESVDYAVMEKTGRAAIVPADIGWSDIGSWQALWQASHKDQSNNVVSGDVVIEKTQNCHIHAGQRLVAAVGAQNLVIVETADAVLVADQTAVQNVKQLVEKLRLDKRTEANLHRKVYRPWGSYEGIDSDEKFQVKRISVKPGGQLSLQTHARRAEHWVVVRGVATVTCGDKTFDLQENESTYIPLGARHRLENRQDGYLDLIEVQTGDYFGEDDIVRLDDKYGRKPRD